MTVYILEAVSVKGGYFDYYLWMYRLKGQHSVYVINRWTAPMFSITLVSQQNHVSEQPFYFRFTEIHFTYGSLCKKTINVPFSCKLYSKVQRTQFVIFIY